MPSISNPASPGCPSLSIGICGAGIAGLATAILLAKRGLRPIVFEARRELAACTEGAFLTLAPNGIRALSAMELDEPVSAAGIPTTAIEISNHHGRRLAVIDQSDGTEDSRSVTIRRGTLATILASAARRAGAELHFGSALSAIEENAEGVTVTLENGEARRFDAVIACDGLSSPVRRLIFGDLPRPSYTGLIGTGGIIDVPSVPATDGLMRMTFGRKAYFGYIKQGEGPVFWFNSFPSASPHDDIVDPESYAADIRRLHEGDPGPIPLILSSVDRIERCYPIHDVPPLARWHTNRIVLAGDAAHAVAPHAGQGASMALEDAVVLAACLAADDIPAVAFARFEALRKDRTRKVMEIARRNGSRKQAKSAVALFMRDLILPLLIPFGVREARRILQFRVDAEPLAMPPR